MRVPTPNVSLIEFVFCAKKDLNIEKINSAFEDFSKKSKIIEITKEKLVSIDFNHNPASSIIDASLTNVVGKNMGKISAWYDNEWGFSNRMCDIAISHILFEKPHSLSYHAEILPIFFPTTFVKLASIIDEAGL